MNIDQAKLDMIEAGFLPGYIFNFDARLAKFVEITNARQQLAQQPSEPKAWLRSSGEGSPVITDDFRKLYPEYRNEFETPLYTQQPSVDVLVEALDRIRGIVLADSATDSDKLIDIVKIVVDRNLWKITDSHKAMKEAKTEKDVK